MAGFKYNINCNQAGAIDAGLLGSFDLDDLGIIDMLDDFSSWEGCKKMIIDGSTYYLFSWKLVPDRIPFSRVKSRSAIKKRFEKYCEFEILEAYEENARLSQSWYKFGPRFADLKNLGPSSRKADRPSRKTVRSVQGDGDDPSRETATVSPGGHNDYTNESIIKESNYNEEVPKQNGSLNEEDLSSPSSAAPLLSAKNWGKVWASEFDRVFKALQETDDPIPYSFSPRDFGGFNQIRKKLVGLYKGKHKSDPDEDTLFVSFKWLLDKATGDKWLRDNWSPANINTQFNSIIALKNGRKVIPGKAEEFNNYFAQKYAV